MTTCSRDGCDKKLNKNNTTGHCGSGCRSPDAPAYQRAKDTRPGREPKERALSSSGTAMERFRLVAEALGKDADAELEEFAQAWLDGVRAKLEG